MIREKIYKILAQTLAYPEVDIKPQTLISMQMGADSLDMVDIQMQLDEAFGLDSKNDDFSIYKILTVADLVAEVEKKIAKKETAV